MAARLDFSGRRTEEEVLRQAAACPALVPDLPAFFAGDNLDVMGGLLSSLSGRVDLGYLDPPFNTGRVFRIAPGGRTGSAGGFRGDSAYSDDMDFEAWLGFIRDRLILVRELLSEEGSVYFHIDTKTGHYVKILMDEVFGKGNFLNDITRVKSNPKNFGRKAWGNSKDMILFYARRRGRHIWNDVREPWTEDDLERLFRKRGPDGRRYTTVPLHAPGETADGPTGWPWRGIPAPPGRHWRRVPEILESWDREGRIEWSSTGNPRLKRYADESPGRKIQDIWDLKDPQNPVYPTQKSGELLSLIIRQSSRPGGIFLDPFAGSGASLKTAHELGRLWAGVDASPLSAERAAQTLAGIPHTVYDVSEK